VMFLLWLRYLPRRNAASPSDEPPQAQPPVEAVA